MIQADSRRPEDRLSMLVIIIGILAICQPKPADLLPIFSKVKVNGTQNERGDAIQNGFDIISVAREVSVWLNKRHGI